MDSETVRKHRQELGMSQAALARVLGVHPMTVSKWERDVGRPPGYLALALIGLVCQQQAERKQRRRRPPADAGEGE